MRGVVEVYRGDEKILEEPNMIMDNMGSQIAFWMSLPRGFGDIASASAIYDTSNYTVRAASLGKDAAGYSHHAHKSDLNARSAPFDSTIRVISYNPTGTNYKTSEFASEFITERIVLINSGNTELSAYVPVGHRVTRFEVLPEDSHPRMQRLESKSTLVPNLEGANSTVEVGHNLNRIDEIECLGCYAPRNTPTSNNVTFTMLKEDRSFLATTTLANNNGFNSPGGVAVSSVDPNGFIRVTVNDIQEGRAEVGQGHYYKGLLLSHSDGWDGATGDLSVHHIIGIRPVDLLCLNFFGRIYTIGLWGFDVQEMLKQGKYPPYTQDIETIKYKLFARKTFNKDLTYYNGDLNDIKTLTINWQLVFK